MAAVQAGLLYRKQLFHSTQLRHMSLKERMQNVIDLVSDSIGVPTSNL